jgi:hypothetical protein
MLALSVPISLATVSNAATMLAKLLRKPLLSLLMPGTGKFILIPETLTLMLDVMVRRYPMLYRVFIAGSAAHTTTLWPLIS